jgi:hypothetical protein
MRRGKATLPTHNPPMKTPNSIPNDIAVEPITSASNCNQTTSYMSAAQPLPKKSNSSARRSL